MLHYIEVDGVDFGDSPLESVQVTPEGRAMGSVPGWSMLFDPEYCIPTQSYALDRVNGRKFSVETIGENSTTPNPSQVPWGDQIALYGNISGMGTDYFHVRNTKKVSKDRWSFFCVVGSSSETLDGNMRQYLVMEDSADPAESLALSVSLNKSSGNIVVYERSSNTENVPIRLYGNTGITDNLNKFHLVMVTFSIENGLRIFYNGMLVAEDSTDTTPLRRDLEPGEVRFFRFVTAYLGMTGMLDVDLADPRNALQRKRIEDYLMDKYDIASA